MKALFAAGTDGVDMNLPTHIGDLLQTLRDGLMTTLVHGNQDDPVLQRLFPPAVSGNDELDAEVRSLISDDLLASKLNGLDAVVDILERCETRRGSLRTTLVDDEPHLLLGVFNDVRLALGARIGIQETAREDLPADADSTVQVIDLLAYLQEQLLRVLDPASLEFYDDL